MEDGWSQPREEVAIRDTFVTSGKRFSELFWLWSLGKVVIPDFHSCKPSWLLSTRRLFYL